MFKRWRRIMNSIENNKQVDCIKLRIPSKPEYVSVVRLTISAIANRCGFNIEDIEDIKVAVGEACTNAIIHVESDKEKEIAIDCRVSQEGLCIVIVDNGSGFDYTKLDLPDLRNPKESGLGIFIIKSLMDEVEFSSSLDGGTSIKMLKKRSV